MSGNGSGSGTDNIFGTSMNFGDLTPPNLMQYFQAHTDHIREVALAQTQLLVLVMGITAITGIGIGLLVWRRTMAAEFATNLFAAILTIPSLAMLTFMIGPFGLGWVPTVISLWLYAQLPVIRNTIAGMRSVDPAVMESARAMGMGPWRVLLRIQFPLAWPVIIAGLRVSSMMIFGISAIAAYVGGPGFGDLMFSGLAELGAFNSMNETLIGAFGITLLALTFDALFVILRRLTTSRGVRV
ncbi:MAG: ABC transporter permease [Candidatus Nanopelagicales bacterium]